MCASAVEIRDGQSPGARDAVANFIANANADFVVACSRFDLVVVVCFNRACGVIRSSIPTSVPTTQPTSTPTWLPTALLTLAPTSPPTIPPTSLPTGTPTMTPSTSPAPTSPPLAVMASVGLAGMVCDDYSDAEEGALVEAVAALVDGIEERHINSTLCNDISRRRKNRRGLLSATVSVDMEILAPMNVFDETANRGSGVASGADLASHVVSMLSDAIDSGAFDAAVSSAALHHGSTVIGAASSIHISASTKAPTSAPTMTPLPAGCTDGLKNGDESDVDCGGSGCPGCAETAMCIDASDCVSRVCLADLCRSPYPTPVPTPLPSSAPTFAPCEAITVPPSPQLAFVMFSSTGGQLFVTFDSDTDRAGYGGTAFHCDAVLEFVRASFATCTWTAGNTLTVSLDAQASCSTGDNVTSLDGVLRPACGSYPDCSCWPTANASSQPIAAPQPPIVPEPRIVGGGVVGSCRQVCSF